MTNAVLFDMDGVLVNSEDYWVAFEQDELLPQVVPDADVDVTEITGLNYRETYEYLESTYGTAVSRGEFIDRFNQKAQTIYHDRVSLLSGTHDLLAELEDRGLALAVVSSSPHDWIAIVLERFDLEDRFDDVISAEEIDDPGKPDPAIYEYAADTLGVAPDACVAIEDSAHGVLSATRAGTTTIAYSIDAHDDIDLSPADTVVETPTALRETVLELT